MRTRIQTEREGFEPSIRVSTYAGLANRCLQPLGHLSGRCRNVLKQQGFLNPGVGTNLALCDWPGTEGKADGPELSGRFTAVQESRTNDSTIAELCHTPGHDAVGCLRTPWLIARVAGSAGPVLERAHRTLRQSLCGTSCAIRSPGYRVRRKVARDACASLHRDGNSDSIPHRSKPFAHVGDYADRQAAATEARSPACRRFRGSDNAVWW